MSAQVLVWLGAVMVAAIAVAVLWVLVWAVCWSAAWARNWWPWRHEDTGEEVQSGLCRGCWDDDQHCDGVVDWCNCTCTWLEDWAEQPLPPERTWEQMTSHQLPVVDGTRGLDSAGIVRAHGPWRVEAHMSPSERKHWQRLERNRKRRAGRAEMGYRAHYAAMGFEYPSGLLARVREAAP